NNRGAGLKRDLPLWSSNATHRLTFLLQLPEAAESASCNPGSVEVPAQCADRSTDQPDSISTNSSSSHGGVSTYPREKHKQAINGPQSRDSNSRSSAPGRLPRSQAT